MEFSFKIILVTLISKEVEKMCSNYLYINVQQFVMKVCSMQNCAVTMVASIERHIHCKSIKISFRRDLVVLVTDL